MGHVFISYARGDSAFAELLSDRLAAEGFEPWRDTESLRAGGVWAEAIDAAIAEATALVVILTPESKKSEYVTYEFAFALGNGVPVIPVLLKKTRLHPRLEKFHYLNFAGDAPLPWDDLVKRVAEELDPLHLAVMKVSADLKNARTVDEGLDAARKLVRTQHTAAREALAHALRHPLPEVSFPAAVGLAELGDERGTQALVRGLSGATRDQAVTSLRSLGKKAVAGMMAMVATHYDEVEGMLHWIIGYAVPNADEEATPPLLEALRGGDAEGRRAAARMLRNIGTGDAAEALIEALDDEDEITRLSAVLALKRIFSKYGMWLGERLGEACRKLSAALRDESVYVRVESASTLGLLGHITDPSFVLEPSVVPALTDALSDQELCTARDGRRARRVSVVAASALVDIGGAAAAPGLLKALDVFPAESLLGWVQLEGMAGGLAEGIIDALGKAGDARAAPRLIELLDGKQKDSVQNRAATALGRIRDASAAPSLILLLKTR